MISLEGRKDKLDQIQTVLSVNKKQIWVRVRGIIEERDQVVLTSSNITTNYGDSLHELQFYSIARYKTEEETSLKQLSFFLFHFYFACITYHYRGIHFRWVPYVCHYPPRNLYNRLSKHLTFKICISTEFLLGWLKIFWTYFKAVENVKIWCWVILFRWLMDVMPPHIPHLLLPVNIKICFVLC